jgi:iron complex transport system substrate-binding protein
MHSRSGSMIPVRKLSAILACCCAGAATSQPAFTDDAGRTVVLPTRVERVFAAGAPAEVLLYTLAPEKLAGRNQIPSPAALEFTPPEYRTPLQIVNLPDRDDPRYDAELRSLDIDVYVDYGTVDDDYVAALEAISRRTGVPGVIFDGRLTHVPAVYRRLGAALGVGARSARLAAEAERLLVKYRNRLAAPPLRVYLACSQDGLSPCFSGHSTAKPRSCSAQSMSPAASRTQLADR